MPAKTNLIPARINPDLQKERIAASFDLEEFQSWWHGGLDKLKEKREYEQILFKDLDDGLMHEYLSHEDLYNNAVKHTVETCSKLRKLQNERNPGGNDIWPKLLFTSICQGRIPENYPFATHISMFVDVIKGQGTPEQIEKFGKPAEDCRIIGTYAQTEMAHGTNVRGIETRADYDRQTDEFVLNTPSLQAYKWWPGGMGHTANYAMVVAQLYIDGIHKGIQMFIVQLRDLETHMPMPGIDIGEVGKKIGMAAVNQGYLGLKNVRIPRTNMLMRNAQVLRDGTFKESPSSKISYLTMVYTRCLVVGQNLNLLAEAATIATRYAAVRRQSPIDPDKPEPQILDHMTQQLKLFPEIATVFAYRFSRDYMWQMYDQTVKEIDEGDFTRMQEMHLLSSALKALCTTDSCAGIERLRLACGGHSFLTAANFGTLYGNAVAAYTYEGENTVLLLQIGRFLMKAAHALMEGKQLQPSVAYLALYKQQCPQWNNSWEYIVKILQYTAAHKTGVAFENLSKRLANGQKPEVAANNTGIELAEAADLHGRQFVATVFLQQITGPQAKNRSPTLNNVLENLLELYLVHTALRHRGDILRFVPLTDANMREWQTRLELVLQKLRPDAVAICDGFDFHDRVLNSALGAYDGNVYERLMDSARKSPLNQKPVPDSFEKYLKPFFKSKI